jgi:ABC-type oligopeptide transport system ATPase subunit
VKTKIEIKGARVHNLKNIDLTINHKELTVITGVSGSGKSTLGRCLLRLEAPSSGHVFFEGEDIMNYNKKQLFVRLSNAFILFVFNSVKKYKN